MFYIIFQNKSPLPDGATDCTGCVFCDAIFKPLVEMHHAMAPKMRRSAGRGGGTGRGRGRGRGRSRGKNKPKDKMAQLAAYFV